MRSARPISALPESQRNCISLNFIAHIAKLNYRYLSLSLTLTLISTLKRYRFTSTKRLNSSAPQFDFVKINRRRDYFKQAPAKCAQKDIPTLSADLLLRHNDTAAILEQQQQMRQVRVHAFPACNMRSMQELMAMSLASQRVAQNLV